MITDAQLTLSRAQAVTTGTQVSTNTIDLISTFTNWGIGQDRRLYAKAEATFVGGTSVQVQVIVSATANLASPTVLASGPVVPVASLAAGAVLLDIVCPQLPAAARFLGVQYVSVGTFSAGAAGCYVMSDVDHQPYVPTNTGY